jgi:hypothetical protein
MPRGQFRQSFAGAEPVAFVSTQEGGIFVTETLYQSSGYQPRFEELPSREEHEAASETQDIEADEGADIAKADIENGLDQFETLALAMARFPNETDAWKDFTADCEERLTVTPRGGPTNTIVPNDIWEYWASVAAGANPDYDRSGRRIVGN